MDQPLLGSRLLEACNVCRKRKVKCDRQRPACSQCSKSQTPCAYTDRIKVLKTPRRRPTKAKLLEERLERMESLLRGPAAILNKVFEESASSVNKTSHLTSTLSNEGENPEISSNSLSQGHVSTSTTPGSQELDEELVTEMAELSSTHHDAKLSQVFKVLPPKEEAISLVEIYFSKFNSAIPLFHPESFMHTFRERYGAGPNEDPSWWACLNTVLAFGSRLQAFKLISPHDGDQDAWGYIENALSLLSTLAVSKPSLSIVQALLGMTLFIQATPMSRSYTILLSTAIRFGQSIGLHRQEAYFSDLTPTEIEQRKRVFWIGYIVDKDISMRSGHPPIQHDDDIDVDFPSDTSKQDSIGYMFLSHGLWPLDFFRLRIQLAILQGSIHSNLYSAKASRLSDETRRTLVRELDEKLRQWKDSTSLDFQPDHLKQAVQHPFDILHIMVLYFTYFNCLTLIHRSSFQNMSWKTRSADSVEPFNPRNFSSKPIVIDAARNALKLLKLVPHNNYAILWAVLQFSVSAIITLLRNIQINPSLPTALPDFNLVNPFLDLFCAFAKQLQSNPTPISPGYRQDIHQDPSEGGVIVELMRIRKFCFRLQDCAKQALEATNPANSLWMSGYEGAARHDSPRVLSPKEIEAIDAEVHRRIQAKAASDSNESRAAFVQAFETSFHEMAMTSGLPVQQFYISPTSSPPKLDDLILQVMNGVQVEQSLSSVSRIDSEDTTNPQMPPSPTASSYDASGLWNWWDLIDMDSDSSKHGFGSALYH